MQKTDIGSPFWQDIPTESLRKALEWRKQELQRKNQPARQAEAKKAIRALEKEIGVREGKENDR